MSEKSIENITSKEQNFGPTWIDSYPLPDVKFNGHCLINKSPGSVKVINLHISYTFDPCSRDLNIKFTLDNWLFGSVKLTKNTDTDKYKYSGYPMRISFSFRIFINTVRKRE